ncbi:MAG: hypothetical protein H5U05_11800 [Candidatus Aminicenantes bacterium]|nr:hypothetical protein [Candidatus Aminicenantes bacterium]
MSYTKSICAALLALSLVPEAVAEPVFFDSFESGDMSATNEDGFTWGGNNATSVVTPDQVVYNNGEKNVPIPSGRDWDVKEGAGDHHLRFRFGPGRFMSEQRFKLGRHYQDIWIAYWIRVPINFKHGDANNKFLSVWPKSYDRPGTVTWQTRPNENGGAQLVYQDGGVTSGETGWSPFISYPDDQGRWMHVVARVKSASGPDSNDGIIQFFRRWEGETDYTKIHEKTNADTWDDSSSEQGISQGYIMGWANDPYDQNTEWFVDEFSIYTSNPIEEFISNNSDENRPNPPTLELIR